MNVLNEIVIVRNNTSTIYKIGDLIEGYYNSSDGKFYTESTFITEIEAASGFIYNDLLTNTLYRYDETLYQYIAISGGSGGHEIENSSGTTLTQRDTLQFGSGFNVSDDSTSEATVVEPDVLQSADMADIVTPLPSYTGGNSNPTGTIISFMGTIAPQGYLACDGSTKNISNYPRLANFFLVQFGSVNYFGGDGTTTFAVPDLRGEFLRGTGTNSHTDQGSGANVGEHQDATNHKWVNFDSTSNIIAANASGSSGHQNVYYKDSFVMDTSSKGALYQTLQLDSNNKSFHDTYTSRPTNTSVLYCIKD